MSNGRRLLLLASSGEGGEADQGLDNSLHSWCQAGLLGEVAHTSISALASSGYEADCWRNIEGSWLPARLREAVTAHRFSEVWLAVLRQPNTDGGLRETEEEAHAVLRQIFGSQVDFKAITVGIYQNGAAYGPMDCSATWDAHFLHDPKLEPHESAPREAADWQSPMELCSMVALCVAGGWSADDASLPLPGDRHDGAKKPVRLVHCKMRVLHALSMDAAAMPDQIPTEPPWPLPKAAGVARALPGTVPPLDLAMELVDSCGFKCNPPPQIQEEDWGGWFKRVLRAVFRPIPEADEDTRHEAAVRRMADKTGGLGDKGKKRGFKTLKAGDLGFQELVDNIRSCDFPLPGGASGASRPIPETWKRLRSAVFGLVDATDLPDGLEHPKQGTGERSVRLVWTDPTGLGPPHKEENGGDDEEEKGESLMERMASAIRTAQGEAMSGFFSNAQLLSISEERGAALAAQKKIRRMLGILLAALCLIGIFALDQVTPFLGDLWESVMPWGALRLYGAREWPIGWLVIAGGVALAGLVVFLSMSRDLLDKLYALAAGNEYSKTLSASASHYAAEMLRLKEVAEQFADHRRLITEFLYRPFGARTQTMFMPTGKEDLAFDVFPPPSMLVACADSSPEKLDEWQKQRTEETIEAGWLTNAYREALALHAQLYQSRLLGDYETPDQDTTPYGSVVHRDRQDGSKIYGARTDFLLAVVGDGTPGDTGWAIKEAAEQRKLRLLEAMGSDAEMTTELFGKLGPITAVHGSTAGISPEARQFMDIGPAPYTFSWDQVLSPKGDRPQQDPAVNMRPPQIIAAPDDGEPLAVSWHLTMSGPVQPRHLSGWQATHSQSKGSEEPRRQVV